jgi:hypothetical protein
VPVSHELRCVFVHVPKTGGTSIECALGLRGRSRREDRRALYGRIESDVLKQRGFVSGYLQHLTAADLRALAPAGSFSGYFSFAIVRNPWDRLVSSFVNKDPHLSRQARAVGVELEGLEFEDYVDATGELRHAHLQPQWEYLMDSDGKRLVDFVGRFESLQDSFREICRRLGIRRQLPHAKKSQRRESSDFRDYYTEAARKAVGERYARDIALFGYEFREPAG